MPLCTKIIVKPGAPEAFYGFVKREGAVARLLTRSGEAEWCFASPKAGTEVVRVPNVKVEKSGNYAVVWADTGARRSVLVLNWDVYERVVSVASQQLETGRAVAPMVILLGPPGSGKSSLAYTVLPGVLNVPFEVVLPSTVLSKWVGESERRMKKLFDRARAAQPFLLVFEEGDWLIAQPAEMRHETHSNVVNIAKTELAMIANAGDRVFSVVTTNLDETEILPEMRRAGRGLPITVPYLDSAGIDLLTRLLFDLHKADQKCAEMVRTEAKRRKLSPADISMWVEEIARTGSCGAPPAGYSWLPPLPPGVSTAVFTELGLPLNSEKKQCPQSGVHYYIETKGHAKTVVLHAVVRHLIETCGTPPVVLKSADPEEVKRAVRFAKAAKAPLVVWFKLPYEAYAAHIIHLRDVPVIFLDRIEGLDYESIPSAAMASYVVRVEAKISAR